MINSLCLWAKEDDGSLSFFTSHVWGGKKRVNHVYIYIHNCVDLQLLHYVTCHLQTDINLMLWKEGKITETLFRHAVRFSFAFANIYCNWLKQITWFISGNSSCCFQKQLKMELHIEMIYGNIGDQQNLRNIMQCYRRIRPYLPSHTPYLPFIAQQIRRIYYVSAEIFDAP